MFYLLALTNNVTINNIVLIKLFYNSSKFFYKGLIIAGMSIAIESKKMKVSIFKVKRHYGSVPTNLFKISAIAYGALNLFPEL